MQIKETERKPTNLKWLWVSCLMNFQTALILIKKYFYRSITVNWYSNNDQIQLIFKQWSSYYFTPSGSLMFVLCYVYICSIYILWYVFDKYVMLCFIIYLFLCWHLNNKLVRSFHKSIPLNRATAIFHQHIQVTYLGAVFIRH